MARKSLCAARQAEANESVEPPPEEGEGFEAELEELGFGLLVLPPLFVGLGLPLEPAVPPEPVGAGREGREEADEEEGEAV